MGWMVNQLAEVEVAIGRVMLDLDRARGLVADAMKRLFATFERLRDHLKREREHYERAIQAISGSTSEDGLVGVIREVLAKFVEDIVNLSRSSVRILVEVETLRDHANIVAERGHRIEQIARTTRTISLNARIEAQRFGESGAVFRVVADEIKTLASEASSLSHAIRNAIAQQAKSLEVTHEAANQLAATDLDVAVASHKKLEATIARLGEVSKTSTLALDEIQREIDAAIQALQFEDMLDQLLGSIGRKLQAIRLACDRNDTGGLLRDINTDQVTQRDVSAGTVELF
jgi:methyl-accepting chemotaxis protein